MSGMQPAACNCGVGGCYTVFKIESSDFAENVVHEARLTCLGKIRCLSESISCMQQVMIKVHAKYLIVILAAVLVAAAVAVSAFQVSFLLPHSISMN